MTPIETLIEKQAIKELIDTFSNLADIKDVAAQGPLFTEDGHVTTYIGGKLFADLKKEIESDQSVKDAQVDAATADSVAYRYTQANENTTTRESCIAHLSADKELAVVCATSGQMSANELKDLLASSVKFN